MFCNTTYMIIDDNLMDNAVIGAKQRWRILQATLFCISVDVTFEMVTRLESSYIVKRSLICLLIDYVLSAGTQ